MLHARDRIANYGDVSLDRQVARGESDASAARRLFRWFADRGGSAVVATAVGLVVAALFVTRGEDPSIGEQLDAVRTKVANEGLRVREYKRVRIRAGGQSHVLVLERPQRRQYVVLPGLPLGNAPEIPSGGRADEIRVYDEVGGDLREAVRFAPFIYEDGGEYSSGLEFHIASVLDIDRDGDDEVLGYYLENGLAQVRIPVGVSWDEASRRYQVAPVVRTPPQASQARDKELFSAARIFRASGQLRIGKITGPDRGGKFLFKAYGLGPFAFASDRTLVAGFHTGPGRGKPGAIESLMQIKAYSVFFKDGSFYAGECNLRGVRVPVLRYVKVADDGVPALKRLWVGLEPRLTSNICSG